MIEYKGGAFTVPYLFAAHFIKGINRLQVQIVDLGKIDLGGHDFPRVNLDLSAVPGQNFFNGMHDAFLLFLAL